MAVHDDVLGEVVSALLARSDELSEQLADLIAAADERYRSAPPGTDDIVRSCRDNVVEVLRAVIDPGAGLEDLGRAARATARRRAEADVPLEAVLTAFRCGGRFLWEQMTTEARRAGTIGAEAVLDAGASLWTAVDRCSAEIVAVYERARSDATRDDTEHRRGAVERLLGGRGDRAGVHRAAQVLGLAADIRHAVLLGQRGDVPDLDLGGDWTVVWQALPAGVVGLVPLGEADVAELVAALRRAGGATDGPRLGVAVTADGLATLPAAHEEARTALASLPPDRPGVARLADRLTEAIVAANPGLADQLLRAVLGPVMELDPAERDLLLLTVRTWLAVDSSAVDTANRLACHRNTVLNRLRRFEDLTGRPVDATTTRVDLALALMALDVLGERAAV